MNKVPNAMVAEAKSVFLEAMRGFYGQRLLGLMAPPIIPGAKRATFKKEIWRVEDLFFSGSDGHSASWTTMTMGDMPFWQMSRQGRIDLEALPFLSRALMENYSKSIFLGGRGPERYEEWIGNELLVYENEPLVSAHGGESLHDFDEFYRIEKITSIRKTDEVKSFNSPVGFHRIQGMRLFHI